MTLYRKSRVENSFHIDPLSPCEREVLELVVAGLSNRQIVAELLLALRTVKTHIQSIFSKFDVSNRVQTAAHAYELGFDQQILVPHTPHLLPV